jgi:hypothetical protein
VSTAVYLEVGSKRVFACALDWPGWCRSGKTEELALEALAAYAARYAAVPEQAGIKFPARAGDNLEVVERLPGGGATDFGVPEKAAADDEKALTAKQAARFADLVTASWAVFDRVVAGSPAELRKGPRGGGRDRDKMVEHVLGAEDAYARKMGIRIPKAEPKVLRDAITEALRSARQGVPMKENGWLPRYAARRVAWHVLDHAWEMEDRSELRDDP